VTSLEAVRAELLKELGEPAKLHFINTRLILTVGVSLDDYPNVKDAKQVEKTVAALKKMGFLKGGAR
jgi:hypothetical protein